MSVKNCKSKKERKYKRTNRSVHHIFIYTVEMILLFFIVNSQGKSKQVDDR